MASRASGHESAAMPAMTIEATRDQRHARQRGGRFEFGPEQSSDAPVQSIAFDERTHDRHVPQRTRRQADHLQQQRGQLGARRRIASGRRIVGGIFGGEVPGRHDLVVNRRPAQRIRQRGHDPALEVVAGLQVPLLVPDDRRAISAGEQASTTVRAAISRGENTPTSATIGDGVSITNAGRPPASSVAADRSQRAFEARGQVGAARRDEHATRRSAASAASASIASTGPIVSSWPAGS